VGKRARAKPGQKKKGGRRGSRYQKKEGGGQNLGHLTGWLRKGKRKKLEEPSLLGKGTGLP